MSHSLTLCPTHRGSYSTLPQGMSPGNPLPAPRPATFLAFYKHLNSFFGARQTETPCRVPAFSVAHWEQLQQEKQELECRFKAELQGLRAQQRRELGALEERLKAQHMAETKSLHSQHQSELEELQFQQQEQVGTEERL